MLLKECSGFRVLQYSKHWAISHTPKHQSEWFVAFYKHLSEFADKFWRRWRILRINRKSLRMFIGVKVPEEEIVSNPHSQSSLRTWNLWTSHWAGSLLHWNQLLGFRTTRFKSPRVCARSTTSLCSCPGIHANPLASMLPPVIFDDFLLVAMWSGIIIFEAPCKNSQSYYCFVA